MAYEHLLLERHDHVAVLTLNRPERLNAITLQTHHELMQALAELKADDQVRAAIITGAGRGFCSGADLGARPADTIGAAKQSQNDWLDEYGWVGRQALSLYGFDKPLIAAMNGVAAGAGMSLALACDLRVGSTAARFKTVFIERNLSPDSGMSFFLPRIVGYSRAADLIYTSRAVEADEAYRIGLLDRLVSSEQLMPEALRVANEMTRWPPVALRASKKVLQHSMEVDLDAALRYELTSLAVGRRAVNDAKEMREALVEKRAPKYTGN